MLLSWSLTPTTRCAEKDWGATDLYLTVRQPNGTWSEARNLGRKVNSRYFEFGARISPDKKLPVLHPRERVGRECQSRHGGYLLGRTQGVSARILWTLKRRTVRGAVRSRS